jgi:hypothetical protein
VHLTRHAVERWIERVDSSADESAARAAIVAHAKIIDLGIRLKARSIILGTGVRLVLCGDTIVTVIGKG